MSFILHSALSKYFLQTNQKQFLSCFRCFAYHVAGNNHQPLHCLTPRRQAAQFASQTLHPKPEHFSVPDLSQSVEKYLEYVKPLVSHDQWVKTCQIAAAFLASRQVARLQKLLEQRAKEENNWLFDWWLGSYLTYRVPVVVHSNPAMRMKTFSFRSDNEWLAHAAAIIWGVLSFMNKLESSALATEFLPDGKPLCMAQYYLVLGNCRIPGLTEDQIVSRFGGPSSTCGINHICVFYRNKIFRLQFRHPTTHEMIPRTLLLHQLEHIVNAVRDVNSTAPPVGLFTGLPRDAWGQLNALLRQNSVNSAILADLEHSLFILCLDDTAQLPTSQPTTGSITLDPRETASAANLLHGNLTNSGNRWFDKTLQFIISRDGSMGVNFEHTPSDAGAFVPITSDVYSAFNDLVTDASDSLPHFAFPKELDWIPFPNMTEEIAVAYDSLKQLIAYVQIEYGMFRQFGSSGLKPFKVSPDAFVQVALQLTYARLHPDLPPPPTYESGSLRRFHLGRTDTIRSCSQATVQFTQSMRDNHSKLQERAELLRVALQHHQDFTRNLIAGHAFDRHLFGLRQISITSQKSGEDTQEITNFFTDPTYTSSLCYRLSTSQVRAPNDVSVLFGPVDPNGYGVCYNIHRDAIQISASAFRSSNQTTHPSEFLTHFAHALSDMYDLLKAHTV